MSNPPSPSPLSELTVTCHQCGSADMDRLDRKEYRCRHCGAITVISDDDAERVEEMLRRALSRPAPISAPAPRQLNLGGLVIAVVILVLGIGLPALLGSVGRHGSRGGSVLHVSNTVPVEDVTMSPLVWNARHKRYEGTLYNHSGYTIDVPRYTMTLFTAGHRSGDTWSDTVLNRLLPGEYEPIFFDPRIFSSEAPPDRYEFGKVDEIDRNRDEIARLELTKQQLVHQDGSNYYKLVGIVHNTQTRPVDQVHVLIMLYGADHQLLASGASYIGELRPGEDGLVDENLYPDPAGAPVAAYEYLVDAIYADRRR